MTLPVESSTQEIVNCAHPIYRDSAGAERSFEILLFCWILREEHEIVDVDADMDRFAVGRSCGDKR